MILPNKPGPGPLTREILAAVLRTLRARSPGPVHLLVQAAEGLPESIWPAPPAPHIVQLNIHPDAAPLYDDSDLEHLALTVGVAGARCDVTVRWVDIVAVKSIDTLVLRSSDAGDWSAFWRGRAAEQAPAAPAPAPEAGQAAGAAPASARPALKLVP